MITKIYGVDGLTAYMAQLRFGNIELAVEFTGGALTDISNHPATYATSDQFHQLVIENSAQYKRGKIYLVGTMGKEEPKKTPTPAPAASNAEPTPPNVRTVDVPDKAAAIEWLKENYPDKGYTTTKLTRSREEFNNACAECGVVFNIG